MTDPVEEEVQAYYRVVSRYIDLELEQRGDAAFWEERVRAASPAAVLELGAGTGRVTEVIAPCASRVVALDLSHDMIERARAKLGGDPHVALVVADMRTPCFRQAFDLVIAPNDPFTHLAEDADRDAGLATAAALLRSGGRFLLDGHRLQPSAFREACAPSGFIRGRSIGGGVDVVEEWRCAARTYRCHASFEYRRAGERLARAVFHARLWTETELRERCARAGLRVVALYGGYDLRPWDPERSAHLIAEAVRE